MKKLIKKYLQLNQYLEKIHKKELFLIYFVNDFNLLT
jgi:hypothetical protein